MTFTLSPAQDAVAVAVNEWLSTPTFGATWRYLAGYAGTGKTSIAKKLAEGRRTAFCAFTGKAASILRERGCADATTLHKLIYRPQEIRDPTTGKVRTEFVPREDGPLDEVDLVVLDECSMVDSKMATDLLSYGKPVLVLGDPFQLPPIGGAGHFVKREPHWVLTEVHRQAKDSGILRLATDIREGRGYTDALAYAPDCAVIDFEQASDHEAQLLAWPFEADDIGGSIIVGTHRMRHYFNGQLRTARKCEGSLPNDGEQLVCLQNDHRRGLLNGTTWRAEADARPTGSESCDVLVRSIDDPSAVMMADCWTHDFIGNGKEKELDDAPWAHRARRARFAYGYALTCHKAQGSQYDRAIVVDEGAVFREDADRWRYTAITRAAKKLVVVRR